MADVTYYVDTDVSGGTGDGSSWANAYATLASCNTARKRDITAEGIITIKCRGVTNPDGAAAISGWTTDSTHYVIVTVDLADRFTGKYPTDKYRIEGTDTHLLEIYNAYTRIIGIPVKLANNTANYKSCIRTQANPVYVSQCLSTQTGGSAGEHFGFRVDSSGAYFYGCIASGFTGSSDASSGFIGGANTVYFENCIAFGNRCGFNTLSSTATNTNCISANNVYDWYYAGTITYSASDDAQAGTGNIDWTAEGTDWGNVFTDYANGDFSLKDYTGTGAIKNQGTDQSATFDSITGGADIIGTSWHATTPSIGAFEIAVASGPSIPILQSYYRQL